MRLQASLLLLVFARLASAQSIDWPKVNQELLRHYQALIRIDTTDPPGNETKVAEYVQNVLEAEGIPVTLAAKDPARANLIARLKGNGSKRPILLMGHTDTVKVDASKWTFPPFSAELKDGYIYGRGTDDNKWQVAAGLMTMLLLKREQRPARPRRNLRRRSRRRSRHRSRHRIPGQRSLVRNRRRSLPRRIRRRSPQQRPSPLRLSRNRRKAPERSAPGRPRPLRPRLASDAHQRDSASLHSRRKSRDLGPAHALQRHHPHLLRKAGHHRHPRRSRPLQRIIQPRRKPPPAANIWPSTTPATTPCCTPRSRPTSSPAVSRST